MVQAKAALVVGAGPGLGVALLRKFAAQGLAVAGVRRDAAALHPITDAIEAAGGRARAISADARVETDVEAAFDRVEQELGPLDLVVFNTTSFKRFPIADTPPEEYRALWETMAFAAFLTGRAAARRMAPRGAGAIIFSGATAALRGGNGFAAMASAKFAQRALAQSMARELGPKGVHVAHAVIDGVIGEGEGQIDPAAIAETYWAIYTQPRSAWTFEFDVRPFKEAW